MAGFIPLKSQRENVGHLLKFSKRRYSWTFTLSGQCHEILLFHSVATGHVTIMLDGVVNVNAKVKRYEEYPININGRVVYVFKNQMGQYDLRVGRFGFTKLLTERSKLSKLSKVPSAYFEPSINDTHFEPETVRLHTSAKNVHSRYFSIFPGNRM